MALSNLGEKFAAKTLTRFWAQSLTPLITNSDYEGEIKGGGADRLNILSFADININDYTKGTDMTLQALSDTEDQLIVNQQKSYYFGLDDIDKFEAYVNDIDSACIKSAASALTEKVDTYVLGNYLYVKAGHQVGTDRIITGSSTEYITVNATTGVATIVSVAGIHTSGFTSSMVGKGIKITAGTVATSTSTTWWKIDSFTTSLTATLKKWDDSAYNGDTLGGTGCGYTVSDGNGPASISKDNAYQYFTTLSTRMTASGCPKEGRWIVVNAEIAGVLLQTTQLVAAVPASYEDVVKKGLIGSIAGFTVYQSEFLTMGPGVAGYFCMAGTKDWCTFAMAFTESGIEDINKQFGKAYKGLSVYGAKVATKRRQCGGYLHLKVS